MKRNRIKSAAPLVLYLLCAGLCLWLASCTTTRTVEHRITVRDTVKSRQTDTLLLLKNTRDSVFLHDSVYLEGATIVKERFRERWHVRTDTVWKKMGALIETAHHETTDKKEKEKEGTNWFSVFMVVVTGIGLVNFVRKR
jgi:lipoprotein